MFSARRFAALLGLLLATACQTEAPESSAIEAEGELFAFRLELEDPGVQGSMHGSLFVTDADGRAVTGASVLVHADMPAHAHQSEPVVLLEAEPGAFATDDVELSMPGQWRLKFSAARGDQVDHVTLDVEVR